jgi:hypothetical protein
MDAYSAVIIYRLHQRKKERKDRRNTKRWDKLNKNKTKQRV